MSRQEIIKLRERFNCSQAVFARLLNVSVKTLQDWVSSNLARRRYISFPKLFKLKVNEYWRRTGAWRLVDHARKLSRMFRQQSVPIKMAMFNRRR